MVMTPLPSTCAKSLTRLSKPLAILGVALLLREISPAESEVILVFKMLADLVMMRSSTSLE
jgi:hypothetical protein